MKTSDSKHKKTDTKITFSSYVQLITEKKFANKCQPSDLVDIVLVSHPISMSDVEIDPTLNTKIIKCHNSLQFQLFFRFKEQNFRKQKT